MLAGSAAPGVGVGVARSACAVGEREREELISVTDLYWLQSELSAVTVNLSTIYLTGYNRLNRLNLHI